MDGTLTYSWLTSSQQMPATQPPYLQRSDQVKNKTKQTKLWSLNFVGIFIYYQFSLFSGMKHAPGLVLGFEKRMNDSFNVQTLEISVRLSCSHKHYWLTRDVGHWNGCTHLKIKPNRLTLKLSQRKRAAYQLKIWKGRSWTGGSCDANRYLNRHN